MRSTFRDASKIIFRMGRVNTVDKFIACSFDFFHPTSLELFWFPKATAAQRSRAACGACIAALRQLCGKNNSKTPCQN
jgi:hypothetical protein